jgi:hypothetical protein
MKFYETLDAQREIKKWKKKLKASGFRDIERSEMELSSYSFEVAQKYNRETVDYYAKCSEFLHNHTFPTKLDEFIWSEHADGRSLRDISSKLESHDIYPPLKKDAIRGHIVRLEAIMLKKAV